MYSIGGNKFVDDNGNVLISDEVIEIYKKNGMEIDIKVGDAEIYTVNGGIYRKEIRQNCTTINIKWRK
jgi:hypothetical protein